MITIHKVIQISGGTPPYTYTWVLSNSCATVDVAYGTTTGTVEATFEYPTIWCLENTVVQLNVTDATDLCMDSTVIPITNPCTDVQVGLVQSSKYVFIASVSGVNPPFTYDWSYDTNMFYVKSQDVGLLDDGVLKLTPVPGANITTSTVTVSITDSVGCTASASEEYIPCGPTTSPASSRGFCIPGIPDSLGFSGISLLGKVLPCEANTSIDFSSLNIYNLPAGITYAVDAFGYVTFTVNQSISEGVYTANYTVKDTAGNESDPSTITFTVPDCTLSGLGGREYLTVVDKAFKFLPEQVVLNGTVEYDVDTVVSEDAEIDWDTFTFIPRSGQTVSTDGKTLTESGVAEISLTYDLKLRYEFLTTSASTVVAVYTVNTTNGIKSNTGMWVFDSGTVTSPVAVGEDFCTKCEEPSPYIDVTANDTDAVRATLSITQQTSYGSIYTENGTVTYIADQSVSAATDTFKYIVYNADGAKSNEATVTVYRASAGISPITPLDISCQGKTLDLEDLLEGQKDPGTWSDEDGAYTAAGGVISNTTTGSVDFTSLPNGTYKFLKTVNLTGPAGGLNCPVTSEARVTIDLVNVPSPVNDTCSTATTIGCPVSASEQYVLYDQTLKGNCPIIAAPSLSSEPLPASWAASTPGDLWYSFTYQSGLSTIYITVVGDSLSNPQVAVYNDATCDCSSLSLLSAAAESSGGNTVSINPSGFNVGQCYRIRVSVSEPGREGSFALYVSGGAIV